MGVFGNDREYDFLCVGVFPSVFVLYICVCMCVCSTEGEGERGRARDRTSKELAKMQSQRSNLFIVEVNLISL